MKDSYLELWQTALPLLQKQITSITFDTMVSTLIPVSMTDDSITLVTKESYYKNALMARHYDTIRNVVNGLNNDITNVIIVTEDELTNDSTPSKQPKKSNYITNLIPRYVFDTFVRGKSNDFAYASAVDVANNPSSSRNNPLFLYGGVGLGKTHLMHAIGNQVIFDDPEKKVLYISSETFTNEMIASISSGTPQKFREKYRDIDLLLIDDIQFIADKEGTQEEFFHTFNEIYNANKQIVISSDKPPKEIKKLEERLMSRFAMGVTADVKLPDFETRTAILEKKVKTDNVKISNDVIQFISKNIVSNIRELEGALNKVTTYAKFINTDVTIEIAEKVLQDLLTENTKQEINVQFIQEVVANYYGITKEEIQSKKRTSNIAYPRQVAMYLSRKLVDLSLIKIGEEFGGRDHSTIIHGCEKISQDLEKNDKLKDTLIELENKIKDN